MQNERFTTQRETSSPKSDPLTTRLQRENYATERAALLFGCYRRGDANDPDTYVAAIAAVLSLYDLDIIREATDPRTGVQTSEKFAAFMPNSGELKAYCEAIAARKHRLEQLAKIPRPLPVSHQIEAARAPGEFANIFVPEWHPRYARLCEWTKTAAPKFWKFGPSSEGVVGLWVSMDVWEGNKQERPARAGSSPDWSNLKLRPETIEVMGDRIDPQPSREDAA